jgi:phosphoenolpyruvate synthase/pyruvate phosphate dikinase
MQTNEINNEIKLNNLYDVNKNTPCKLILNSDLKIGLYHIIEYSRYNQYLKRWFEADNIFKTKYHENSYLIKKFDNELNKYRYFFISSDKQPNTKKKHSIREIEFNKTISDIKICDFYKYSYFNTEKQALNYLNKYFDNGNIEKGKIN